VAVVKYVSVHLQYAFVRSSRITHPTAWLLRASRAQRLPEEHACTYFRPCIASVAPCTSWTRSSLHLKRPSGLDVFQGPHLEREHGTELGEKEVEHRAEA
jgi:hypothetical protein